MALTVPTLKATVTSSPLCGGLPTPLGPENSSLVWKPQRNLPLRHQQTNPPTVRAQAISSDLEAHPPATSMMSKCPPVLVLSCLSVYLRRHAVAAITGLDHAYYESYSDLLLSALRGLAAGAKNGELVLGYNAPPLHFSHSRLPAPQVLRECEAAQASAGKSPLHSCRHSYSLQPSFAQVETQHFPPSVMNDAQFPLPDSDSSPSPSSANGQTPHPSAPAESAPSFPPPHIGPMPVVPRRIRVSANNKTYCYAVCIGRRPGVYFTWSVLFSSSLYGLSDLGIFLHIP